MIDTTNKHLVGIQGTDVVLLSPPRRMSADEAVVLAAWLVVMAQAYATITFEQAAPLRSLLHDQPPLSLLCARCVAVRAAISEIRQRSWR
jgi:hypothetical protein